MIRGGADPDGRLAPTPQGEWARRLGALPPSRGGNDKSVQVAQATTSDTGQSPEQERHWAETLSCELTNARRDIELLQRLEQERERFLLLEQDLVAARRDVETQNARAAKASRPASTARKWAVRRAC